VIPRHLRRWILIWTPVVWLTLELLRYPKNVSLESGFVEVLKGFFSDSIGAYPPVYMLVVAVALVAWAVWQFSRRTGKRGYPVALLVNAAVFAVWGFVAGGGLTSEGFALAHRSGEFTWLCQTVAVIASAACLWMWAKDRPERAALFVTGARRTWALYHGNRQGMVGLWIIVVFVLIALLAPFLADHSRLAPDAQYGHGTFEPPSLSYYYLMGTDDTGLSVLAEFIWSARISLLVGIMATLISTILGAGVGVVAGYYTGWIAEVSMRITDAFLCIPWLPLAMVLAATWGQNYVIIIVIIGVTSWPGTARVVRSDALRVRELQFIERARAIGSGGFHIMGKHILPNVFPLIFANTILVVAAAITAETELSFLGLGDPLNFSWGTMLHNAWGSGAATLPAWWFIIPPGVAIVFVVLAFTFMGTAFDEILDPKLRPREFSVPGGDQLVAVEPGPDALPEVQRL
jgi:peptide/nickel transport system permease protein